MIPKRESSWTIAIPASLTDIDLHLREKTRTIGHIARAAAIFRIDEIVIYPDNPAKDQERGTKIISLVLNYLDTPQYLRKELYSISKNLRFSGILPPLRTPHHPLVKTVKSVKKGEYREGVVTKTFSRQSNVNVGLDVPAILKDRILSPKTRITTQITVVKPNYVEVVLQKREEINIYWGYSVTVSSYPLGEMINQGDYDFAVLTSKYGKSFHKAIKTLRERWLKARKVLIAFGSPREGLRQILRKENTKISIPYIVLNTIPQQGTKTIRVEEAVYATLAILNVVNKK